MTLQLNKVHINQKQAGTNRLILTGINPAIRLGAQGDPPLYIQGGRFYWEGGDLVNLDSAPHWLREALENTNPVCLKEAGIDPDKIDELFTIDNSKFESESEDEAESLSDEIDSMLDEAESAIDDPETENPENKTNPDSLDYDPSVDPNQTDPD